MFNANGGDVIFHFKGDTSNLDKSLGSMTKSILTATGITKALSTGFNMITSSTGDAIARFDKLNAFPKVMSSLGVSTKEAQKAIDKLSDKLTGLPTTLDDATSGVSRLVAKNGDVGKSTDMFLALNNAIIAGNAPMQTQATALEQITQAYSKGKPDMMEWRTLMTAMPGQLKQVAKAMGYETDALGEALRKGDVSMEKFMQTIMKLNKEGVNGFESFEKQAKNAVGGIGTSLKNMRTAITRGMEKVISGLDKGLKKAGFGGINKVIQNIGKKFESFLKGLSKSIEKVDFKKIINGLKVAIPLVASLVAITKTYSTVVKTMKAVSVITQVTKAFLGLTKATQLSATALKIFNALSSINPFALAITGIVAFTALTVALSQKLSATGKAIKSVNDTTKAYNDTMKEITTERDRQLSASMNEIYRYQALKKELDSIVSTNGVVKKGYEDRAKFIVSTLSKALGMEIQMNGNVIKEYQKVRTEIDKTIEKKKALAYFEAYEPEYKEALKEEATLHQAVTEATNNNKKAKEDYEKLLESEAKRYGTTTEAIKGLLDGNRELLNGTDETAQGLRRFSTSALSNSGKLKQLKKDYEDSVKSLKDANKAYADGQVRIDQYRRAEEALAQGNYQALQKIFVDTVNFNGKTVKENNKKYEDAKAGWLQYKTYLQDNSHKFSQEFLENESKRINDELKLLDEERTKANEKIKQKNDETKAIQLTAINDQLALIKGKQYEWRDVGNGNVQLYVNGIAQGEPMVKKEAKKLTDDVTKKLKEGKLNYEQAGEEISKGVARGIEKAKRRAIDSLVALATDLSNSFERNLKIASPSKVFIKLASFIPEGVSAGIDKAGGKAISSMKKLASNLENSFDIPLSPNLTQSGSLHYSPNVIVNNNITSKTDPLGQTVTNIKTFSNGAKNDYNYGAGI